MPSFRFVGIPTVVSNLSMSLMSECEKHQINSFWAKIKLELLYHERLFHACFEKENSSCETTVL